MKLSLKTKGKLKKEGVILVYLHGSQVTGFTNKESDIDIAILLSKRINSKKYFAKSLKLPELFTPCFESRPIHVSILNQASPLFKYTVFKNGELLCEKNKASRITFELHALQEYEDTKHLRDINYYYLRQRIKNNQFGLAT